MNTTKALICYAAAVLLSNIAVFSVLEGGSMTIPVATLAIAAEFVGGSYEMMDLPFTIYCVPGILLSLLR